MVSSRRARSRHGCSWRTTEATSFFDTGSLKRTLERLVDFDRLNAGHLRGERQIGKFRLFRLEHPCHPAEHVMASGALPPGFPAVESKASITGTGVLFPTRRCSGWSRTKCGATPWLSRLNLGTHVANFRAAMFDVMTRDKEIRYSSRSRAGPTISSGRRSFGARLPRCWLSYRRFEEHSGGEAAATAADRKVFNIVHLIYPRQKLRRTFEGTTNSRAPAWRSIGGRDTTTRDERCATRRCSNGLRTLKVFYLRSGAGRPRVDRPPREPLNSGTGQTEEIHERFNTAGRSRKTQELTGAQPARLPRSSRVTTAIRAISRPTTPS